MYNAETKRIFLHENSTAREWVFNALAPVEEKAGKDIAEMGREDSLAAMEFFGFDEPGTISSTLSILQAYAEWRGEKGLSVCNDGILTVKAADIDFSKNLSKVLFKDENDLIDSIGLVRSLDDGFVEVPTLVLFWLGLKWEELMALRDNDVDLSQRSISLNGEVLVSGFSDRVYDALQRYVSCRSGERLKGLSSMEVRKDYSVDSFLKRMLPANSKKFGTGFTRTQLNVSVNSLASRYMELGFPRRHTFSNVWRSGRFHALWELEQTGVDVTAKENRQLVESTMRNRKNYYNAIRMYEVYKQAFYK